MVDPTTVNKFLAQPSSGSDVGLWGDPINNNMLILDDAFGGIATVTISSLSSASIVLSSLQYRCAFIKLTGTAFINTAITFPSVGSFYTIINDTLNSSTFTVTAQTTIATQVIGMPPGTMTDIMTSSNKVRFRGLPHVGAYWDYGGSSVPAWVTACTVPPYLYCNAGTFAAATYPALAVMLGSTTLPDFRGRLAFNFNDGTSRITSSGGIDGNTRYASGGAQTASMSQANLPSMNWPVSDPSHAHTVTHNAGTGTGLVNAPPFTTLDQVVTGAATITMNAAATGITVPSGGSQAAFATLPLGVVSGIRMIRAG